MDIYGSNVDTSYFYDKLTDLIDLFGNQLCIICGDFNLIQNFNLDTHHYINIYNPRSRENILEITYKRIYRRQRPLKFNYSLLLDPEYVKLITQRISNTVKQYIEAGLYGIDN